MKPKEQTTEADKTEEYSVKDELKEEGSFFLKDLATGVVKAGARLARGTIGVFRHHPKVKKVEAEVKEHTEEIEEAAQEG